MAVPAQRVISLQPTTGWGEERARPAGDAGAPLLLVPDSEEGRRAVLALVAKAEAPARFTVPPAGGFASFGSPVRREGSQISFKTLRLLSKLHDITRICIQKRTRQVQSVDWDIVPREDAGPGAEPETEQAKDFFATEGGFGGPGMRFRSFIAAAVNDLLALDALVLYRRPNRGGGAHSLLLVDPVTVRPMVDKSGYRPLPPAPAFEQVLNGRTTGKWTSDEMRYEMLNPSSDSVYGLSPVEVLMMTVETAIRGQLWNLDWFTHGNLPEGLIKFPDTWTPAQVSTFAAYWDALLAGNIEGRQQVKRVPMGVDYVPTGTRKDMMFERMLEWLATITCLMFDLPPASIGLTGSIYKFAQEGQIETAKLWGLQPLLALFKEVFDDVLQGDLGLDRVEFKWKSLEEEDKTKVAARHGVMVAGGLETPNEARADLGVDRAEGPYVDRLFLPSPSGPVVLGSFGAPAGSEAPPVAPEPQGEGIPPVGAPGASQGAPGQPGTPAVPAPKPGQPPSAQVAAAAIAELRKWQRKALGDLRRKGRVGHFETVVLPAASADGFNAALSGVTEAELVRALFEGALREMEAPGCAGGADWPEIVHALRGVERSVDRAAGEGAL